MINSLHCNLYTETNPKYHVSTRDDDVKVFPDAALVQPQKTQWMRLFRVPCGELIRSRFWYLIFEKKHQIWFLLRLCFATWSASVVRRRYYILVSMIRILKLIGRRWWYYCHGLRSMVLYWTHIPTFVSPISAYLSLLVHIIALGLNEWLDWTGLAWTRAILLHTDTRLSKLRCIITAGTLNNCSLNNFI